MSYASAASQPAYVAQQQVLGAPFQPAMPQNGIGVGSFPQYGGVLAPALPAVAQTRILLLAGFAPSLKTRDIQSIFLEWEEERGGFKIKWIDDTSCYVVFADALTAFLSTLANMPNSLIETPGEPDRPAATLRAYAGDDAATIIASVQQRGRARSNAAQQSIHGRRPSMNNGIREEDEIRATRLDQQAAGRFIGAGIGRPNFAAVAASGSAIET